MSDDINRQFDALRLAIQELAEAAERRATAQSQDIKNLIELIQTTVVERVERGEDGQKRLERRVDGLESAVADLTIAVHALETGASAPVRRKALKK